MNIILIIIETVKTAGIVLLLIGAIQIERRLIRIERELSAEKETQATQDDLPADW